MPNPKSELADTGVAARLQALGNLLRRVSARPGVQISDVVDRSFRVSGRALCEGTTSTVNQVMRKFLLFGRGQAALQFALKKVIFSRLDCYNRHSGCDGALSTPVAGWPGT